MAEPFDPKPVCRHLQAAANEMRAAAAAAGLNVPTERVQSILSGASRAESLRRLVEGDAVHAQRARYKPRFP